MAEETRKTSTETEKTVLGEIQSNNATIDDIQVYNGVPHLLDGSIFINKFKIDSRIGWDDTLGATYYAVPLTNENKELILRVDCGKKQYPTNLFIEAALLKTAEAKKQHLLFTQIFCYDLTYKYPWLAVFNRGGPTVRECLDFLESKKFTHGTAGRFAFDVLSILEFLHSNAFLATNLNMEIFCVDPCSRNVFLNDLSFVKADQSKRQMRIKPKIMWRGNSDLAPLSHHGLADLTQWDELESFFYFVYEIAMGSLPWTTKHINEVETMKLLFTQEDNFKDLPEEYLKLWNEILHFKCDQQTDYTKLKDICIDIYGKCGGVTDLDQNYDFEVDFPDLPEEELPRFVLEKRPIEENTEDNKENIDV